ncbi:uncharacterized protein LOC128735808 [Sabethes cyaneus]|uniref:uncharacterized protein LOC128735808 n=1 Tax=Sabethes cyaneus TaxID=53552 RepID=UPI00237D795E|nr:uncharacterized protein LOC128735808 [Sabethes cyaneus]
MFLNDVVATASLNKWDKCNIANYRGITSLCAESKVFETIIKDALFAACRHYISTTQHGFYPARSLETNLVDFGGSFCAKSMSNKVQVDAIYMDLKAAFDSVNHTIL